MNPRGQAVGIIWRQGKPIIDDDWVAHLNPAQREWVEHALAMRGFRFNGNSVEEIDNGNDQHSRP